MVKTKTGALVAAAAFGGLALSASQVGAMPMIDRAPAVASATAAAGAVQQARWVCGPFRCFWRPHVYRPFYPAYGYGWHRPYGYGGWHHRYGWGDGWHHGWHGGWHHGWHGGWHHGWRHHW